MPESAEQFGWLVKIKSIHDLWLPGAWVGSFKICFTSCWDVIFSSLISSVIVLSLDHHLSCLKMKSQIMIVKSGFFFVLNLLELGLKITDQGLKFITIFVR